MNRLFTSLLLGLVLAAAPACGGGDDDDGGGSDGDTDIDAGDGDTPDAAGEDGPDAAPPDAFVPPTAESFCTDYEAECGFGGKGDHEDMEACTAAFDGCDDGQIVCV